MEKEFNHWLNKYSHVKDEQQYSVLERPCKKGLDRQTKLRPASLLLMRGKYLILSLLFFDER